jgi:hypothetical protein
MNIEIKDNIPARMSPVLTRSSFATLFGVVANEDLVNPGDIVAGMLSLISIFINA